jgi:hypothetical protein
MTACYLTAAIVSLLLGAVSFRVERYHYWHRYVRKGWVVVLCVAGQAVTYVAAGLLVAFAAHAAGAKDAYGESVLTGFIYGCVPAGAARIPLPGFPVQDIRSPKSAVGMVLSWITQWLDYIAKRRVRAEITKLRDARDKLVELSWELYWDNYYLDEAIPDHAKTVQHDQLKIAAAKIRDDDDPSDGIGCLTGYCVGQITRRYLVID